MSDEVKEEVSTKKRRKLGKLVLGFGILAVLGYVVLLYVMPLFFPLPEGLVGPQQSGVEFTDRDGKPLRRLLSEDAKVDQPASISEIPKSLIDATLAAEDSRYYKHNGIDFIGMLRAVKDAFVHQEFVSGASTVTQQLAKVASRPRPRNFKTKVIEAFTARRIEMTWDKDEILAAYLNRIPYGNQLHGCRAAARGYFGKPLGDLSIAESAFLAGLPNKPTRFNPYRNFRGARARQIWILNRLLVEGWITEDQFEAAIDEKLVIQPRDSHAFQAPHFLDIILDRKIPQTVALDLNQRKIQTTLDLELQSFVENTVETQLSLLGDQVGVASNALQAAVVVIENKTGDVLSLTGSRDFFNSKGGQINGAWKPRSAGSTLKPFTYLLALEGGYTAASVLADVPVEYTTTTGIYRPVNYDRRFHGPVSMRYALANSLNIPAVRTLEGIGGVKPLHHLLTEKLQLTGLSELPEQYGLGLTIGNAEVRLLELTNAYATLARLGDFRPVNVVKTIKQGLIDEQTLFDRESAWIIADILSDNAARADAFGFDSSLRFPFRVASKTGTSTDYRDNWTLGFTPEYTVGVWMGRFDNQPLQNISGVSGAGPIFHDVMARLHESIPATWFEKPEGLIAAEIDSLSGKRVNHSLTFNPKVTHSEFFRRNFLPPMAESEDYDLKGNTILSGEYAKWLAGEGRQMDAGIAATAPNGTTLKITSPLPGTVAFLDADLPNGGRLFPLRTQIDGAVKWKSATLKIESNAIESWLVLEPGDHDITAIDENGDEATTHLVVEEL